MILSLNTSYEEAKKALLALFKKNDAIEQKDLTNTSMFGVYEDYSFRLKNHVSITITLSEYNQDVSMIIVVSGGGKGILNINYGLYKNNIEDIFKWLDLYEIKYQEVEQ